MQINQITEYNTYMDSKPPESSTPTGAENHDWKPSSHPPPTTPIPVSVAQTLSNDLPSTSSQEDLNNERARIVANSVRHQGMGALHGKFPYDLTDNPGGQTTYGRFIKGEDIRQEKYHHSNEMELALHQFDGLLHSQMASPRMTNRRDLEDELRKGPDKGRQAIVISPYHPPYWEKEEIRKPGFLGIGKKTEKVKIHDSLRGKKGEPDWTQFDYFMNINSGYDGANRPGVFAILSIAVPAGLSSQIEQAQEGDIYFFNRLLQALYPGLIGKDPSRKQKLERLPADRLLIIDRRINEGNFEGKTVTYPQPIVDS